MKTLRISRYQLDAALAAERRKRVRTRLLALDAILTGKSIDEAAPEANTTQGTVERCLKRVRQSGLQSLLRDRRRGRCKWRMTAGQVEETRCRIAAVLERPLKPEVRARLVAGGMSPHAAAIAAGVSNHALARRIRLFRQRGIASCLEKPRLARPKKLNPAQLQELRAEIRKRPHLEEEYLLEFIAARFGVRYTAPGLRLLLKREFGILSRRASRAMPP